MQSWGGRGARLRSAVSVVCQLCVVQAMRSFCSTHAQRCIATDQPTAPLADVRDIDGDRRDAVVKGIVDSAAEIAQRRKVGLRQVESRGRPHVRGRCCRWVVIHLEVCAVPQGHRGFPL